MSEEILCIGEVLWDALPEGLFLGGAPFNVACHLHELGWPVSFASRIGDDELGREILRRLHRHGLSSDLIQTDGTLPTGFVIVKLDPQGKPEFEVLEPSAWDAIEDKKELLEKADEAKAIVFGSLVQRSPRSRQTIRQLWKANSLGVFDVNLRPPFDKREVVEESLINADIVKLNDEELAQLSMWFGLPANVREGVIALADKFGCQAVCVTQGADGAVLLHAGTWQEHPGFQVEVADTVGAGDAFLAALLIGLFSRKEPAHVLAYANAVGAFVATKNSATPSLNKEAIDSLLRSRN